MSTVKEKVYQNPAIYHPERIFVDICPGCGHGVSFRILAEAIQEAGIEGRAIGCYGAGCNAAAQNGMDIDCTGEAHGRPPDVATGIKRIHPDAVVFALQGDGDCIAIGAGPFIGALTRAEKITVIMLNNVGYGSTGGQLAPTTLTGQVTATTPYGRDPTQEGYPVHVAELAAMFKGTVYSARGAINSPANYRRAKEYIKKAFRKQMDGLGFSFVEILDTCPTCWRMTPLEALDWMEKKMLPEFPLGEFKDVDRIE